MTSPVYNPVYVIHCSLSVFVDILFYLCVRYVGMCSVPQNISPICFPGARMLARPGTQCNAHPCKQNFNGNILNVGIGTIPQENVWKCASPKFLAFLSGLGHIPGDVFLHHKARDTCCFCYN